VDAKEEETMFQEKEQVLLTDIGFAQDLIGTLTISLSANPLYEPLRAKLRGKDPTEIVDSKEVLFETLFKTWCISPVATLTLCMLSRNYELAYNLIPRFTMVDIDTARLIQLGNLVQLLESPSFTSNISFLIYF
jgi:vacuole morphology and inheritance protein 14